MDVQSIVEVLMAQLQAQVTSQAFSPETALDLDTNEIDRLLAMRPSEPDDKLQ